MSEEVRGLNESLVEARQMSLASAFRKQMTEGQSFETQNTYRTNFYRDVTDLANKVSFLTFFFVRMTVYFEILKSPDQYISLDNKRLKEAAERLCRFVDPQGLLDRAKGPRRPLIVFAFDEAHILTDNPAVLVRAWKTLFFKLHHILQQIHQHPILSLFLSTAARFNLFSASPMFLSDLSNRIQDPNYCSFDPISETSFDSVAYRAPENRVTLDQVAKFESILHFGRPLYVYSSYPFGGQLRSYHPN
jgi:hypothetical protein